MKFLLVAGGAVGLVVATLMLAGMDPFGMALDAVSGFFSDSLTPW